jgi:hypothetical protein
MVASRAQGVKGPLGAADNLSAMLRPDFPASRGPLRARRSDSWASVCAALGLAVACQMTGCGGSASPGAITKAPPEANARAAMSAAGAHHDSLTAALAAVPEFPDAAPPAVRVPKDVAESLKGSAEPWLFAWRVGVGTFRLDQLARTWTRPLAPDLEVFDGNADGEDLRLTFLAMPGPNGTTALDPYREWTLVQEGEFVHARRLAAPSVDYIDLANHERRRVLLLSDRWSRVDGALWIDNTRFVIFAGERFAANPWSGGPVLYVVDVAKETLTRYEGPGGDYEGFQTVGHDLDRIFRKRFASLIFDGA